MIKKLRRKIVLTVMGVVSLILLAIFFTLLIGTQRNSSRMSEGMMRQALSAREFPMGLQPYAGKRPPEGGANAPIIRQPILVLEALKTGEVSVISNQLHFIGEDDAQPIAMLALNGSEPTGILSEYGLRYMRDETQSGARIAFTDISMEQDILNALIVNALAVGGAAMLIFFLLSIALARWAVRPMELAWKRQKQFIADASHELKTPLTVILSNADMLQRGALVNDGKNAARLEHINAEARRMKRLVEYMLTLAKTDNSQISVSKAAVDFSYIVKSVALMFEPLIYDAGKSLAYEIDEGLMVFGDTLGLQELIHILLDNALKYSTEGANVNVRLKKTEQHTLLLEVNNGGIPLTQNELKHIFLRFYRGDEARSANDSFGLGLSIAQSIVKEHAGKIWAKSDTKSSNSFYVSLNIAR